MLTEDDFTNLKKTLVENSHKGECCEAVILQTKPVEFPLTKDFDILLWLRNQLHFPQFYWKSRDEDREVATLGAVKHYSLDSLDEGLQSHKAFRLYGGMGFDPFAKKEGVWEGFQASDFFLPRLEVIKTEGRLLGVFNCLEGEKLSSVFAFLDQISCLENFQEPSMEVIQEEDEKGWLDSIQKVQELISQKVLEKLVLARRLRLTFSQQVCPFSILSKLKKRNEEHFLFCLQLGKKSFLGSSPELLYQRKGLSLWSEALAGTTSRGKNSQEDKELAHALLHSSKEQQEHGYVVEYLHKIFQNLCEEFSQSKLNLKLGKSWQHLYQKFSGRLKEKGKDQKLLQMFHPTPAVGAFPKKFCPLIHEIEHFDRGWYAGVVGWCSQEDAEWSVAIRSALIEGQSLTAYAGAGIVEGSCAKKEWKETELKLSQWRNLYEKELCFNQ